MRRVSNNFYSDYVLNIPSSQLNKPDSLTDYYFHINIHSKVENGFVGSFVGYASKEEIKTGIIGKLYRAGTYRTRRDGSKFRFSDDTYEVDLADLTTPPLTDFIKHLEGFAFKKIRQKT